MTFSLFPLLSLTYYSFKWNYLIRWASQLAQLVKNPPAMQETPVQFLVRKVPWRRDRPPIPVFMGFPSSLDGKESICNARDLGLIPGWEDPQEEGMATHSNILA